MCGISGILSYNPSTSPVESSLLNRMRDSMLHRGPDGGSSWISANKKIGLAHRRLAIIDLSEKAAQPMVSGNLWITFNGEIYNHAEIRAELDRIASPKWNTDHSDTEVILKAFEHWGIECINKLRGMFAFALWDDKEQELWIVRDRIGVKPLYYTIRPDRFAFASEIKALLEIPGVERAIDETALFHYLSFLTTPAPQTLFKGIQKLPAATWIKIDGSGKVQEHRYWDALDHTRDLKGSTDQEVAEMVLDELRSSVNLRAVSDVPVGIFLSGGVDSSTNAALFAEKQKGKIKTFTIGYDAEYGSYANENTFAKFMADKIGAEYHEKLLNADDLIRFLPQMIHLQDEPIADPVCVPVYYVSKLARDNGVIVCQMGEGADELFWGYEGWKTTLKLAKLSSLPIPKFLKKCAVYALNLFGKGETWAYEKLSRIADGHPVFWGGAEAFTDSQKKKLLSPRLRTQFGNKTSWDVIAPIYRRFNKKSKDQSPVNWMTYLEISLRIPELLLMRVDKMTMGTSLEAREPFLDHKLIELALSIPQAVKTRGGESKALLKKAVRGLIPDEIIDRKKQGFAVPIHEWLMGKLGEDMRAVVWEFCNATDLFDPREIDRILREGTCHHQWYLFNLALWWKHYIAPAETTKGKNSYLHQPDHNVVT